MDRQRRQGLCYDDDDDWLLLLRVLCTRHHGGVVKSAYVRYAGGMVKDEIGDKEAANKEGMVRNRSIFLNECRR